MGVVGGVDQVDVVGALADEIKKDLPQTGDRDGLAKIPVADLLVLAEHAPQGAAGKKDCTGAVCPRDRRLFPFVEGGSGHHRSLRHPAQPPPLSFGADRPALSGAEIADHIDCSFPVFKRGGASGGSGGASAPPGGTSNRGARRPP